MPAGADGALVLGPLLRHVDESTATVWVETPAAATVAVVAGGRRWSARTFGVHGHHYALVTCHGLAPGSTTPYAVEVDGVPAWPEAHGPGLPAPVIRTLAPGRPLRLAFGSCRTSVGHDEEGNRSHGVDALRTFALALAGVTRAEGETDWPDLLLFLGDQVYADETTEPMREFIASRRDLDEPPGTELKDYEEYAHLYALAWSDPVNRWLLSTLPTAMVFDDHDVRDDWNTSAAWRREVEATGWWHERIVGGLASYWVYQHLGNLSPDEREKDEMWRLVAAAEGPDEVDLTEALDAFAARADRRPETYRWSYAREIGGCRLVVVDSRAARVVDEDRRAMLDPGELAWLDGQLTGGVEHLLVATSLPFLLPEGLHHLEAFSEALAGGAWGRWGSRLGERLRQGADLEHWAAFQASFRAVAALADEVAGGRRGPAPRSVTFLSGDVHHSYVSQVRRRPGTAPIVQAVCSPIRNPLARRLRYATAALSYAIAGPAGRLAARSTRVPDPPWRWDRVAGPWFDNTLATLAATPEGLDLAWVTGVVDGDRHDRPRPVRVGGALVGEDATVGYPDR